MFRSRLTITLGFAVLLASTGPASATTIIEKDLDALCDEADAVFIGTVASTQARLADDVGHIETFVTFTNLDPLHGVDRPEVTLRFSGGQIGDVVERIEGVPEFHTGDRAMVFARTGVFVSPVVGFNQGALPVTGEGADTMVELRSYQPVGALPDGRRLLDATPRSRRHTRLSTFAADVRTRLAQRGAGQ